MYMSKICSGCGTTKDFSDFGKSKSSKDGFQYYCKTCAKQYREELKLKEKPQLTELCCSRCKQTKAVSEFPVYKASSTGYFSMCSVCKKEYFKEHVVQDDLKQLRKDRVIWLRSLKDGKPCVDCGKALHSVCMDYDHVRGDKFNNVSLMASHGYSQESILKEIEKCDLVCVFCHNRRTMSRLGAAKYLEHIQRNVDIINGFKDRPCASCGCKYESFNMQFNHIEANEKIIDICQLKSAKVSRLIAEIEKCEVLCAACHRLKTMFETKDGKYPKSRERLVINKKSVDYDNETKECTKCGRVLGFDKFNKATNVKSGLSSWCAECSASFKREKRGAKKTFIDHHSKIKECPKCHQELSFDSFFKSKITTSGLSSWCKDCMLQANKERRNTQGM